MACLNVTENVVSQCLNVKVSIQNVFSDVEIEFKNEPIQVTVDVKDKITVAANNVTNHLTNVTYMLICSPDFDLMDLYKGHFFVLDGLFVLSDGKKFKLIEDELPK